MLDAKLRDQYRDMLMMREVMRGATIKYVAARYGVSPRTTRLRVNTIASDMMREVMRNTQGDPDHPAKTRWTVEEFTAHPRRCLVEMLESTIKETEDKFPALKAI